MKLVLKSPVTPLLITQGFGVNGGWYRANGINVAGHNGLDLQTYHGQPIYASHDGTAYYTDDDGKQGDGVVIISDRKYEIDGAETLIKTISWHLCDPHKEPNFASPVYLAKGRKLKVKTGDLIGYADNTGLSFGDHLHYGLKPVAKGENPDTWWNTKQNNGFGGAIDPAPYLEVEPNPFQRELGVGASGSDVKRLQILLGMPEDLQTGYFGFRTKAAVMYYQWKNNISPITGYVGPKTLALLNRRGTL